MFRMPIEPGFYDTDALGHVNNTRLPVWFENARNDVFRLFVPDLDVKKWPLVLARIEVDFVGELFFGEPVEIRTSIERIGTSSFVVYQEAWQQQRLGGTGRCTLVHFDWSSKKAVPLTDEQRGLLSEHLLAP